MGLANRLVPAGQARAEAEALAAEIARFPSLCMRTDRASAYAGWDNDLGRALAAEAMAGAAPLPKGPATAPPASHPVWAAAAASRTSDLERRVRISDCGDGQGDAGWNG